MPARVVALEGKRRAGSCRRAPCLQRAVVKDDRRARQRAGGETVLSAAGNDARGCEY
jgi:hypothetical protein